MFLILDEVLTDQTRPTVTDVAREVPQVRLGVTHHLRLQDVRDLNEERDCKKKNEYKAKCLLDAVKMPLSLLQCSTAIRIASIMRNEVTGVKT